ncbi:MAG: antibiotic biosynthesis monooxygenase [Saprospiraceae bacterium]|nr:antibiotic biosynthesis monooxygenase [Saprospiraceae bacterium]
MKFNDKGKLLFPEIYHNTKPFILQCEGCKSVDLLVDSKEPEIMTTVSVWDSEDSLNAYRETELFIETWSQIKQFFIAKPEANSYNKY